MTTKKPSLLKKIKNEFSAMEARELKSVLMLCTAGFFILFGYVFIRSASPALFMKNYGKENLTTALLAMSICLIAFLYFYEKALDKWGPKTTAYICYIGAICFFFISYFFIIQGYAPATAVLMIFKEIYIIVLLEQVWAFFDTVVKMKNAKLLSGFLLGLSSLGSVIGGTFVSQYAKPWGSESLVLITGITLIPAVLGLGKSYSYYSVDEITSHKEKKAKKAVKEDSEEHSSGFQLLKKYPQLLIILALVILSQFVASTTYLRLQGMVSDTIANTDDQTAYFGSYYTYLNVCSSILQLFLSPIIFKALPLMAIQVGLPLINIGAAVVVLMYPSLSTIFFASIIFKTLDYSLFKSAKEMIYVPLTYDVKYKTKQVIDVFGYRAGKGIVSLLITIPKKVYGAPDSIFTIFALVSSIIWVFFGYKLGKFLKKSEQL